MDCLGIFGCNEGLFDMSKGWLRERITQIPFFHPTPSSQIDGDIKKRLLKVESPKIFVFAHKLLR